MNIVVLNNEEEFIQFLDPELCSLTETIEKGGLRTLHFTYYFQDMVEDKKLFKIGNKLWVYGDSNLEDCLYVINTSVKQDIYQENCFECEMEEVLVELNYAPPFTQLELTSNNGFSITTSNGQVSVKVDYAALNYWFGEYFNIGVVQKCLSDYNAQITFTGAMNLMNLLIVKTNLNLTTSRMRLKTLTLCLQICLMIMRMLAMRLRKTFRRTSLM